MHPLILQQLVTDRVNDMIAMHRDMNFTMIRNWTGNSNREEFFANVSPATIERFEALFETLNATLNATAD